MAEPMSGLERSMGCGDVRPAHVGKTVTLMGWVHRRRDLGGLIFVEMRDRSGVVQVVFNPQVDAKHQAGGPEAFRKAEGLRGEYVVAVTGQVAARPEGTVRKDQPTGEVEVHASEARLLNPAKPSPINIAEDQVVDENVRLKYRYLDLRRPTMQKNIMLRHKVAKSVRDYLDGQRFLEIETPMLVRSTPEGARDYLVPSRVNAGKF
ncbi:MAG: amino acid--tRNA ligase-related protein, partial [Candidatus Xenobia bacterium]